MREIVVHVTVQYRSDGPVRKGAVKDRVAEAIRAARPPHLFQIEDGATYAGYSVALPEK